jgi:gamma-glutamylcyclotransferase (GGCT)/AIG2-like uncharacterized protein YtfP
MGPAYLFLYGTLQPAADTRMSRWLAQRSGAAMAASAPGRLVALRSGDGWYPALVPGRAGERCVGTLVRAVFGPGDLALLDRYEGREYRRGVLRVRTSAGSHAAGVYVWHGAPPVGAIAIPGGDFLAWLARTGRSSFTTRRNGA